MRDIILVPTYMRPEYLFLCLERIHNSERPLDSEIWICQDFRFQDEHRNKLGIEWTTEVLDYWRGKLPLRFIQRRPHNFEGNSRNVLEAYKEAAACEDVRYIYLIEDDVLVQPDFFKWHEAVQADGDFMCSVAYRCIRNTEARKDITDPSAYFTSARDYASVGVCWRREKLAPIVEHATEEYYRDMGQYINRVFAGNRFAADFGEQDGLIMRVMWTTGGIVAWPYLPRAYHMGWYGYHRPDGKRPDGMLNDKIGKLRDIICSAEKIQQVSHNFGDIEPLPTSPNEPFEKLYRVQEFL